MDKEHKIWESSDSEFLSFLYAERDREYAYTSSQGINLWVIGAAIVGLLGYAYNQISVNYEQFDWRLLVYYSVTIGAAIIAGAACISPAIHQDRWQNKYRVTTIAQNAPIGEMFGKYIIAISSYVFLGCLKEYGPIRWLYMAIFMLEIAVMVYVFRNSRKLICVDHRGWFFAKKGWEIAYRATEIVLCAAIVFVALITWGSRYEFGIREFEMSCVLAIIIGLIWIVHERWINKKYPTIDRVIDRYVYGHMTKEDAYFSLLTFSQGYDVVNVIQDELEKIRPFREQISEMKKTHEQYLQMIEKKELKYEDSLIYYQHLQSEISLAGKALDKADELNELISEIIRLDARSESIELFTKRLDEMNEFIDEAIRFVKESNKISHELSAFIKSFECKKYGGLCGKESCPYREERFSFRYKLRMVAQSIIRRK